MGSKAFTLDKIIHTEVMSPTDAITPLSKNSTDYSVSLSNQGLSTPVHFFLTMKHNILK